MSILCKMGFHKKEYKTQYIPSIHAPIVEEAYTITRCARCKIVFKVDKWYDYDDDLAGKYDD